MSDLDTLKQEMADLYTQMEKETTSQLTALYNSEENVTKRNLAKKNSELSTKYKTLEKEIESLASAKKYDAAIEKENELSSLKTQMNVYSKAYNEVRNLPDYKDEDIDLIVENIRIKFEAEENNVYRYVYEYLTNAIDAFNALKSFRDNCCSIRNNAEYKKKNPNQNITFFNNGMGIYPTDVMSDLEAGDFYHFLRERSINI